MRRSEMWLLLTEASVIDHRTITEEIVNEWLLIMPEDVTVAEAREALLEHRRSSDKYLMPAHIVQGVKAARAERSQQARDALDEERAALGAFVVYTGVSLEVAAAHWGDAGWRQEQLDVARRSHYVEAIEGGSNA